MKFLGEGAEKWMRSGGPLRLVVIQRGFSCRFSALSRRRDEIRRGGASYDRAPHAASLSVAFTPSELWESAKWLIAFHEIELCEKIAKNKNTGAAGAPVLFVQCYEGSHPISVILGQPLRVLMACLSEPFQAACS